MNRLCANGISLYLHQRRIWHCSGTGDRVKLKMNSEGKLKQELQVIAEKLADIEAEMDEYKYFQFIYYGIIYNCM